MRKSIQGNVFILFSISLGIIIISQLLTVSLYYRLGVSSQNADILFLQNKSIESLSRKFLQVTMLANSARENAFDIFNLNLNIERDIKQIHDITGIMLEGGEILIEGTIYRFPPLARIHHAEINNMGLLLNAYMFVKDIILKSDSIPERENKLVLLTSIIGQLTGKNQSILRIIKKEVRFDQMIFSAVMVIALLIVIIVFLLFRQYVVGSIINPLKNFSARFADLSVGHIGTEIEYIRKDEFGDLYNSFNLLLRILKGFSSHFENMLSNHYPGKQSGENKSLFKPGHMNELFMRFNSSAKPKSLDYNSQSNISLSDKNNIYFFPPDKIVYCSSSGSQTIIHTVKRDFALNVKFKSIEETLPETFLRIHKQYIVNFRYISRLTHVMSGHYKLLLDDEDDTELPVGRNYIASLKNMINTK